MATDNEKKVEGVTLSPEEFAQVKEMLARGAEKDAEIENLKGLVAEFQNSLKGESTIEPVKNGEYCRMRKYEDKWVLGWVKNPKSHRPGSYREMDNITREYVDFLDILVMGEKEPIKVRLLDFLNNCPQYTVRIVERKKLPSDVIESGTVDVLAFSEKTGLMEPTGRKQKAKTTIENYSFVLDLDGKKVEVRDTFINA